MKVFLLLFIFVLSVSFPLRDETDELESGFDIRISKAADQLGDKLTTPDIARKEKAYELEKATATNRQDVQKGKMDALLDEIKNQTSEGLMQISENENAKAKLIAGIRNPKADALLEIDDGFVNGGFETYTGAKGQPTSGIWHLINVGENTLSGWTATAGIVILIRSGTSAWGNVNSVDGNNFICLHHTVGATLTHTLNLVPNTPYTVGWYERDRPHYAAKTLRVSVDDLVISATHTVPDDWTYREATFTATSTSMVLTFFDAGGASDGSVFLDKVTLVPAWSYTTPDLHLDASVGASDVITGMTWTQPTISNDGVFTYYDLTNAYMSRTGGAQITVGQTYTQAYWIQWRQDDTLWRTLFRGDNDHWVIVKHGAKDLGCYSNRDGAFRDTGTDITAGNWQLLVVTGQGNSATSAVGTQRFYLGDANTTPEFAGTTDRVASGTTFFRLGWSGQGPGKLAHAYFWNDKILSDAEISQLWRQTKPDDTHCYDGIKNMDEVRVDCGGILCDACATLYKRSATGTDVCPTGYLPILNEADCIIYSQHDEDHDYNYAGVSSGVEMFQQGCFGWEENGAVVIKYQPTTTNTNMLGMAPDWRHFAVCSTLIAPPVPSKRFQVGPTIGSDTCAPGSQRVRSSDQCEEYAGHQGMRYDGEVHGMASMGCYMFSNVVAFEPGATQTHKDHRPVCYSDYRHLALYSSWVSEGGVQNWKKQIGTEVNRGTETSDEIGAEVSQGIDIMVGGEVSGAIPGGVGTSSFSTTMSTSYTVSRARTQSATFSKTRTITTEVGCVRPSNEFNNLWVFATTGFLGADVAFETMLTPTYCAWTRNEGQIPQCAPGYCGAGFATGCQRPCALGPNGDEALLDGVTLH